MTNNPMVTSLTKALLPQLLNLAGRPALGRMLVVLHFFHLRMMEATVFLGTFNAADIFWYPSPDLCLDIILSKSSTDNSFDLIAWFLHRPMGLPAAAGCVRAWTRTQNLRHSGAPTFANISKNMFSLCHYGVCRLMRKIFYFIHFRIRL